MVGEAHVQGVEGVGECGAADTLVCSGQRDTPHARSCRGCGASAAAGSEARALRGDTPPSRFLVKGTFNTRVRKSVEDRGSWCCGGGVSLFVHPSVAVVGFWWLSGGCGCARGASVHTMNSELDHSECCTDA